jgi:(S)-2-hydroxyglutarate dehydrogenase
MRFIRDNDAMGHRSAIIVGGGIVGLAIARELSASGRSVTLLEKESDFGSHQTGRNSGVIHAGPYYTPGSLKAELCTHGNRSMVEFAKEHDIAHEITGKLLLATTEQEVARLDNLATRAQANGVPSEIISRDRIKELEPFAEGLTALHVKTTGIIDYGTVARKLATLSEKNGAELLVNSSVRGIRASSDSVTVEHTNGSHTASLLINAAGLYSDRLAVMAGITPNVRIIPFRGEYFELKPELAHMVTGLIYPVPDPALPFLGVHFTKMIGGGVHAGPNAVLAMAREGYSWSAINIGDVWSTLSYPGFARLAAQNLSTGIQEVIRSLSPSLFARDLSKLVPGVGPKDLVRADAGVRAQAVGRDGKLVDDFVIQRTKNQVHILNAPSPAATASLAIARYIVRSLEKE